MNTYEKFERIPPQALDVERTVLGAMLVDGDAVACAVELLNEDCFYATANRHIFNSMLEMFEKNIPIDVVTLANYLKTKSLLEAVGDEMYLSELCESIATSGNIEYYSTILIEKSNLRKLISISGEMTTDIFNPELTSKIILDKAESKLFAIAEKSVVSKPVKIDQSLPEFFTRVESYTKKTGSGIRTGFVSVDELVSGFDAGDLIIIAGRPAMGKTSFCLSLAINLSVKQKHPTAIFSLEMSRAQLVERLMCSESRVNIHSLRAGTLPKRDMPKLSFSAGTIAEAEIFIDDTPAITPVELRTKARRLKRTENIQAIIIDYIQLMGSGQKYGSREQEISYISRSLKAVAKDVGVPVIALSQLSRAVENRVANHRPQLSDLRESGAIEQDADIVMFVYRDEIYNKDDENNKGKAEIIIGKQRNGPIGTANLAFIKEYARFENMAEPDPLQSFRGE